MQIFCKQLINLTLYMLKPLKELNYANFLRVIKIVTPSGRQFGIKRSIRNCNRFLKIQDTFHPFFRIKEHQNMQIVINFAIV